MELKAPGIIPRESVSEPMATGVKSGPELSIDRIDMNRPLALSTRSLISGKARVAKERCFVSSSSADVGTISCFCCSRKEERAFGRLHQRNNKRYRSILSRSCSIRTQVHRRSHSDRPWTARAYHRRSPDWEDVRSLRFRRLKVS